MLLFTFIFNASIIIFIENMANVVYVRQIDLFSLIEYPLEMLVLIPNLIINS